MKKSMDGRLMYSTIMASNSRMTVKGPLSHLSGALITGRERLIRTRLIRSST